MCPSSTVHTASLASAGPSPSLSCPPRTDTAGPGAPVQGHFGCGKGLTPAVLHRAASKSALTSTCGSVETTRGSLAITDTGSWPDQQRLLEWPALCFLSLGALAGMLLLGTDSKAALNLDRLLHYPI